MVTPKQQFTLMAFSLTERWNEIKPVVEAVVSSVTFFEGKPAAEEALLEPTTEPTLAGEKTQAPLETPTLKPSEKTNVNGSQIICQ